MMGISTDIVITKSRIKDGYVAIPAQFAKSWLPTARTHIFVFLNECTEAETLNYIPPTDAAKESRVYGLGTWFRSQGVQPGDRLVVTVLDRMEKQYAAHLMDVDVPNAGSVEQLFSEGQRRAVVHVRIERNRKLVEAKKARVLSEAGRLRCEVCSFDFFDAYGSLGAGFAECHHRVPLSTIGHATVSRLDDLAVVCANCHRMLHRGRGTTVESLCQRIEERRHDKSVESGPGPTLSSATGT